MTTYLRTTPAVLLLMALSACTAPAGTASSGGDPDLVATLPDAVAAMVAPGQNLQAVRLSPDDGCYYYRWDGPVETTFLPLRTRAGNPICTRPQ